MASTWDVYVREQEEKKRQVASREAGLAEQAGERAQEFSAAQAREMREWEAEQTREQREQERGYERQTALQQFEWSKQLGEQQFQYGTQQREQEFTFGERQRASAFKRLQPYLEQFMGGEGGAPAGGGGGGPPLKTGGAGGMTPGGEFENPYAEAALSGIKYQGARGWERQMGGISERGLTRSGARTAASGRHAGEVASQVAGARAGYAEAQLGRAAQEKIARRQALVSLLSGLG